MQAIKTVIRWIAVGPAWLFGCIVASILWSMTSCQAHPDVFDDLTHDVEGFGGHYLFGPLFFGARSFVTGFVGMVMVAIVAPAAKREASFVVAAILATIAMIVSLIVVVHWHNGNIYGEEALRTLLDVIPSAVAGFVVAARIPHGVTDKELSEGDFLSPL